jgi:hypothetical protein
MMRAPAQRAPRGVLQDSSVGLGERRRAEGGFRAALALIHLRKIFAEHQHPPWIGSGTGFFGIKLYARTS